MKPRYEDVLTCMRTGGWIRPTSGRNLRDRLGDMGFRMTGPAFYAFMAQLEDAGLIRGFYEDVEIDGIAIKSRTYDRAE